MAEGWRRYAFSTTVAASDHGAIHGAFGISTVWETEVTYWADDRAVDLALA